MVLVWCGIDEEGAIISAFLSVGFVVKGSVFGRSVSFFGDGIGGVRRRDRITDTYLAVFLTHTHIQHKV